MFINGFHFTIMPNSKGRIPHSTHTLALTRSDRFSRSGAQLVAAKSEFDSTHANSSKIINFLVIHTLQKVRERQRRNNCVKRAANTTTTVFPNGTTTTTTSLQTPASTVTTTTTTVTIILDEDCKSENQMSKKDAIFLEVDDIPLRKA
jgi:hypothetical protein